MRNRVYSSAPEHARNPPESTRMSPESYPPEGLRAGLGLAVEKTGSTRAGGRREGVGYPGPYTIEGY